MIVGGGDTSPPNVSFSPDGQAIAGSTITVTISWCDDHALTASSRRVTLDGAAVSTSYTTGTYSGCAAYATSVVTLTLSPGTHTLAASIDDSGGNTGSYQATYTAAAPPSTQPPPQSPPPQLAPVQVTVVSPRLYRDPAQCTLDCGELVQTYGTPAYVSLNTPRSVGLMYRSGRAWPKPVIEVDVTGLTVSADRIGLKLLTDAGAQVYIWGGGGERVRAYTPGVPNRLAVQFDAFSGSPSAGDQAADWARVYTAVVSAYQGTTLVAQQSVPVRVLVDWWNGRNSIYGAGWGVVGAPQYRWVTNSGPTGGLVIMDGDGEMGYWDAPTLNGSTYTYSSPPGDVSTVTFNTSTGNLTRRFPDGSTVTFSGANGFPVSRADRLGNAITFNYANAGWGTVLRSITEGNGRGFTFVWRGEAGYPSTEPAIWKVHTLWSISDALRRRTGFAVDTNNDLVATQDADGVLLPAMQYRTDAPHLMWARGDRRGGDWRFDYDIWQTLAAVSSPPAVGGGGMQRAVVSTSAWAMGVLYSADLNGGVGTLGTPAPALPSDGIRTSRTGPDGLTTAYHQDAWGAPDRVEAPGGVVATAQRDGNGNVFRTTDAQGNVTQFFWNGGLPFLLDSVDDAAARSGTHYTYDAANFYALQQTRVKGQEVEYRSYGGGRLVSVRAGGTDQKPTVYEYPNQAYSDPRPTKVTDPGGHVTTYEFPGWAPQNVSSITGPAGTTSFAYDTFGRDSVTSSPAGRSVQTYDLMNRPRQTVDGNNNATTTDYDALYGRTVTDATGQVYRDSVNALGMPFFSYDPGGRATATTYDAAGRVATATNRRGHPFTFSYDPALGYLTRRTVSDTASGNSNNATYGTDALGRVRWARNVESTDSVFTDSLGRDTLAVHRIAGLSYRYQVSSSYDSLGRRTRAWYARYQDGTPYVVGANSNPTTYVYGSAGELTDVNNAHLYYNNEFAPTTIVYEGRFSVTRGYTAQHTLGAQHFSAADNVLAAHFSYDNLVERHAWNE